MFYHLKGSPQRVVDFESVRKSERIVFVENTCREARRPDGPPVNIPDVRNGYLLLTENNEYLAMQM